MMRALPAWDRSISRWSPMRNRAERGTPSRLGAPKERRVSTEIVLHQQEDEMKIRVSFWWIFHRKFAARSRTLPIAVVLMCAFPARGQNQLPVNQDAWCDQYNGCPKNLNVTGLNVGASFHATAFLQFDLSKLLPTKTVAGRIKSATLHLYATSVSSTLALQGVLVEGPWSITTLTRSNQPPLGAAVGSRPPSAGGSPTWLNDVLVDVDITPAVRAWQSGSHANYGVALYGTNSSGRFAAKESGQNPPIINVVYEVDVAPAPIARALPVEATHPGLVAIQRAPGNAGTPQVQRQTQPNDPRRQGHQQQGAAAQGLQEPKLALSRTAVKFRIGPQIRNPQAPEGGLPPAILQALREQKQAFEIARSRRLATQIKVPAAEAAKSGGVPSGPTRPLDSKTNPSKVASPGPVPATTEPTATVATTSQVPFHPPSQPDPRFPLSLVDAPNVCPVQLGSPFVTSINGKKNGVIFSPDPQNNAYVIEGCSFGKIPGEVHLFGPFNNPGQMTFTIDKDGWTDSAIYAYLNMDIKGELDQDNAQLVIKRGDATPSVHIPGFKFIATRESQLLSRIPRSVVTLDPVPQDPRGLDYTSPFGGASASAYRDSTSQYQNGQDFFNLTKLQRGFVPLTVQLQQGSDHLLASCLNTMAPMNKNWDIAQFGTWNAQWDNNGIRVDWQIVYCRHPKFSINPETINYASAYGLSVTVLGPRGVSPWPANLP